MDCLRCKPLNMTTLVKLCIKLDNLQLVTKIKKTKDFQDDLEGFSSLLITLFDMVEILFLVIYLFIIICCLSLSNFMAKYFFKPKSHFQ